MVTAISQQNTEQGYKIRSYAQKKKLTLKFTGAPQLREAIRKESRCALKQIASFTEKINKWIK